MSKAELTGRSPLRRRRTALDCSAIWADEEPHWTVVPSEQTKKKNVQWEGVVMSTLDNVCSHRPSNIPEWFSVRNTRVRLHSLIRHSLHQQVPRSFPRSKRPCLCQNIQNSHDMLELRCRKNSNCLECSKELYQCSYDVCLHGASECQPIE
jgi:hypothetical protein